MIPFPRESLVRWRRIDVAGREEARFEQTDSGWRIAGHLDVEESGVAASISYTIECDDRWRTRSAEIDGVVGGRSFEVGLRAVDGQWSQDGRALSQLSGAIDIDLGFTPATNTLPIRRLQLGIGESAPVRSAWLRFPELALEMLEQTYTRESEWVYRYVADVDGAPFVARLDIDAYGRVVRYEGLWETELAIP